MEQILAQRDHSLQAGTPIPLGGQCCFTDKYADSHISSGDVRVEPSATKS